MLLAAYGVLVNAAVPLDATLAVFGVFVAVAMVGMGAWRVR